MADEGKTKRERAKLMYLRSRRTKTATEIGKALHVSDSTVRTWKKRDRWDEDARAGNKPAGGHPAERKAGGQPGNKNALYASRTGNHNAEATGEHTRLTPDSFTAEERALVASLSNDHREQLRKELALLTVRERRMMDHVWALQGLEDRDGLLLDYSSSTTHTARAGGKSVTSTSETKSRTPAIDRIIRIEEALTRVQAQKSKILLALQEIDRQQGGGSDGDKLVIVYDYGDRDAPGDDN